MMGPPNPVARKPHMALQHRKMPCYGRENFTVSHPPENILSQQVLARFETEVPA